MHKEFIETLTEKEYLELYRITTEFFPNIHKLSHTIYIYKNYFLPTHSFEISVFWYEHKLKEFESSTLAKIKNKDIIDVGGYVGDSALVFQKYTDKNIYTFEPTNY